MTTLDRSQIEMMGYGGNAHCLLLRSSIHRLNMEVACTRVRDLLLISAGGKALEFLNDMIL